MQLETTKESLIDKVDKIIFYNDKIFIMDKKISKAIFVFDLQGKFLFKISNIGKGIGEYITLTDFIVNNDNVEIYDFESKNFEIFLYCW